MRQVKEANLGRIKSGVTRTSHFPTRRFVRQEITKPQQVMLSREMIYWWWQNREHPIQEEWLILEQFKGHHQNKKC